MHGKDHTRRRSHAVFDVESRRLKAIKIEKLLGLNQKAGTLRVLEIGTGAGVIAHHFATHPKLRCVVTAVDIVDERCVHEGFEFRVVHDTNLPFPQGSFDAIISNHVIEHVGGLHEQENHLMEIHRVMAPDGIGYLATPNRWALVEPHYKLLFLSWLTPRHRDLYVKFIGVDHYDCHPLSMVMLERLLRKTGFRFWRISGAALQEMIRLEMQKVWLLKLFCRAPKAILDSLQPVMPTLVYRLMP